MGNFEIYIISGFCGGFIRGLSGVLKNRNKKEKSKFNYSYFFSTVFISAIIGGAAEALAGGEWKTAFLSGYAGIDFIENMYKSALSKKIS